MVGLTVFYSNHIPDYHSNNLCSQMPMNAIPLINAAPGEVVLTLQDLIHVHVILDTKEAAMLHHAQVKFIQTTY